MRDKSLVLGNSVNFKQDKYKKIDLYVHIIEKNIDTQDKEVMLKAGGFIFYFLNHNLKFNKSTEKQLTSQQ